jgi:hypothetical protein
MVFILSVDTNFAAIDSTKSVYSNRWFYVVLTANQDWPCSLQSRRLQFPGGEYYSFHFPHQTRREGSQDQKCCFNLVLSINII